MTSWVLLEMVGLLSSMFLFCNSLLLTGCLKPISALLRLAQEHHGDGRVMLPLLVTIDKLLSHGCLDNSILDPSCLFSSILFDHLALEAKSCTDVKRLMAMVPVVMGLMSSANSDLVRLRAALFPLYITQSTLDVSHNLFPYRL